MGAGRWLRKSAWRALAVDLRRAPSDAHARTRLLRAAILPAYLLYILGIQIFSFKTADSPAEAIGQLIFSSVLFGGVGLYAWWSERRERQMAEERSPSVSPQVKVAVYREALLLATLVERGASERGLEKELPASIEVITRRVLLGRLRSESMLENLDANLLSLLLAPDGHWTEAQKRKAESALEYMDVMHWALGLGELGVLSLTPEYTIAMARDVADIKNPQALTVLASWNIRPGRNDAEEYFGRCWVELVERGVVDLDAEDVEKAIEIKAAILAGSPQGDYLAGACTIGELSTDALWRVALRAHKRWQILSVLVDVLCEDRPVSDLRALIEDSFSDTAEPTIAVTMVSSDQRATD